MVMAKNKYLYARADTVVLEKCEQIRKLLGLASPAKAMQWVLESYMDDALIYALELAKEQYAKEVLVKQAELAALEEMTSSLGPVEIVPGVTGPRPTKKKRQPSGGLKRRARNQAKK